MELTATEEGCNITPRQGKWAFCPPVWGLLDQAQVVLPDNEQAFLGETIDEAAQRAKDRDESLASAVLATLIDRLPDLREVLSRRLPGPAARRGSAPPWILFAPQASGAFKYNRHLMADHRRIAEQLTASAERAGGLGILEGGWTHEVDREAGIQPLVALNDRQRAVVERVIGGAPLTVVTGPPGCGKSQVVLSVLLNAWACGQSVLFVSSNNNAVDVVRERLERLDSAVPIAVRAGSKEKNNAVGLLRNISTRVGQRRGQPPSDAPAAGEAQLQPLIERREALRKMRDSRVPQKITEQARSAMVAYAEERRLIDAIEKEAGRLEHEWRRHGFGARRLARTRQTVEESLDAVRAWIDRKPDFEQQQRIDDEERRRLDQAITDAQQARDTALGGAGVTDPRTVEELMRHGSPDDLATWHAGLDRILKYAAGDLLTPPEWLVEFERWSSAREAEQASRDLKSLGDRVSRRFDDLSVRIESLGERAQAMTQALDELHRCGMETPPAIGSGLIDDWKKAFSVTVTAIPSRMDRFFPWRPLPKARRRLRRIEQMLLKCLPLATWRHVELIESPGGRDRVSEVLESIARWRQTKEEQRAAGEVSVQVSDVFATLTEGSEAPRGDAEVSSAGCGIPVPECVGRPREGGACAIAGNGCRGRSVEAARGPRERTGFRPAVARTMAHVGFGGSRYIGRGLRGAAGTCVAATGIRPRHSGAAAARGGGREMRRGGIPARLEDGAPAPHSGNGSEAATRGHPVADGARDGMVGPGAGGPRHDIRRCVPRPVAGAGGTGRAAWRHCTGCSRRPSASWTTIAPIGRRGPGRSGSGPTRSCTRRRSSYRRRSRRGGHCESVAWRPRRRMQAGRSTRCATSSASSESRRSLPESSRSTGSWPKVGSGSRKQAGCSDCWTTTKRAGRSVGSKRVWPATTVSCHRIKRRRSGTRCARHPSGSRPRSRCSPSPRHRSCSMWSWWTRHRSAR